MKIIETETGRSLEHAGETAALPALPVDATVYAYSTPDGLWVGTKEPGKPRPVYAGSGGKLIGSVELPADQAAKTAQEMDQVKRQLEHIVQGYMDNTARERNYDSILSLCTYATSTNPTFAAEGQAGVEWRDAIWATCYQILADVESGTRAAPDEASLVSELPVFEWPAA